MARNVKLQTLRISHEPKLSQRETAERAGMSLNRFWMIENGHVSASPDEQSAIANVFDVTPGDLFPTAPPPTPNLDVEHGDRRNTERRAS